MKKSTLLSVLAALALPLGAAAGENINYTFFDAKYVDNGLDESYSEVFDVDGDEVTGNLEVDGGGGFALAGSFAFHENWHAFAEYAATDVDLNFRFTGEETDFAATIGGDVDDWRLGVGFNTAFNDKLDGVVKLSWEDRSYDFGSVSVFDDDLIDEELDLNVDDNGFGLELGLRGSPSERFELNGHVRYSEVLALDLNAESESDILDDAVIFGVGGIAHLTDMFSLGANVETGDSISTAYYVFARVGFAR